MAKTSTGKKVLVILSALLIVGLAGSTVYLYMENKNLSSELALSEDDRKAKQNERILTEVKKLITVPDETAFFILVADPEKAIEEQTIYTQIFDDLQKGDYILVFRQNRQGIQYRPNDKKIVKSAPIPFPLAVTIFGSDVAIAQTEEKLKEFSNQITVDSKVLDGVTQAFVYDVNGTMKAEAESIAEKLDLEVGTTLPASIVPSDQTEIVIVVTPGSSEPAAVQP
jgi:hypothetical protein